MKTIDPKWFSLDSEKLEELYRKRNQMYWPLLFSQKADNPLYKRLYKSYHKLEEVLSLRNAQDEAQSEEEAKVYLNNLNICVEKIIERIFNGQFFSTVGDLFFLYRWVCPDEFKKNPNQYRKGEVLLGEFAPPSPEEVTKLMGEFFFNISTIQEPIQRAFYIHHELVRIHPFPDGNGRVARLAKNWTLMYHLFPPMFIRNVDDKKKYHRSLAQSFRELERKPNELHLGTVFFLEQECLRLKNSIYFIQQYEDHNKENPKDFWTT